MRIRVIERTGSTNAVLLADPDAVEGDWLVALRQDSGRGRQRREWLSLDGNFAGSTVINLRADDPSAPSLALACGLSLIEAVNTAAPGAELMLKWPNDLMLGGAKLAGILLERTGNRVIAGFGVNLAAAPAIQGRATASLANCATISPQAFAPLLAASMTRIIGLWRTTDPASFAQAWQVRAHPLGTVLSVHTSMTDRLTGRFDGIEPDGALRLRGGHGSISIVRAGDVIL